jgi:exosortase A
MAIDALRFPGAAQPARRGWSITVVVLVAYVGWLAAWYWPTLFSMVSFWHQYETYAHGFAVAPIAAWLIWRDRAALAEMVPEPSTTWWPAFGLLLGGGLWIGGVIADVIPLRQFALVTLLVAGTWLIVGDQVARRFAFPLAFLYFAVPFGEFLIPSMIEWTADFTIAALRASGVPVLREGMTFRIPTGSWSVIEACSGVRYLIASTMVGTLYAYLAYRSLGRRLAFVAASIIVPIIANWLRAYMIVMIGHLSNNRLAVGVDHILYGWVFFGIVMLLLFWCGSLWRQDDAPADATANRRVVQPRKEMAASWRPILLAFGVAAMPPLLIHTLDRAEGIDGLIVNTPPVLGEWQPVTGQLVRWTPRFSTPRATIVSTYAHGDDRVGLYAALYYKQNNDSKLVSSVNTLVRSTDLGWHTISTVVHAVPTSWGTLDVEQSVLRIDGGRLLVRRWYVVDGVSTASHVRAKFLQARARLLGRGDAGAIILVSARVPDEGPAQSPALDDFTGRVAESLPRILQERMRGAPAP